jgi:hypothetical protein
MRKFVTHSVVALVLLGTGITARALDGSRPPGANFDLSHWKLTLPDATASEIKQPALATYTSSYFYSAADGAMTFFCPVTGGTTSGTTFPRSELRELIDGRNSTVNWTGEGTHILNGQCRIVQLPSTPHVIIGQVHGYNEQTLVKLQYKNGAIEAYIRSSPTGSDTKYTLFSNAHAGDLWTYQIKVVDGVATVTVNGVSATKNFFASDPAWQAVTFYFKAGAYVQDNTGTDTEGGAVAFYQLSATHGTTNAAVPPTINAQPQSQTIAPGAAVAFNADVSGSAPITFQWRTNGVVAPGLTSSNFSLANFRFAQPLAVNFIASNSAGSVTSSVARLYLNSPTRFVSNGRDGNGRFITTLVGVTNAAYAIETSTNLSAWTTLGTNRSTSGLISFTQTNAAALRFFRARQL